MARLFKENEMYNNDRKWERNETGKTKQARASRTTKALRVPFCPLCLGATHSAIINNNKLVTFIELPMQAQ